MVAVPKIYKLAGKVDPIVLSSGTARLVSTIASPITALLIIRFLSLTEQGYWYTFLGLVTIVNYAELGMGQVIIQFAAYEWNEFSITHERLESETLGRLKSIFRIALLFGGLTALFALLIALPLGYFIMAGSNITGPQINWLGPWVLVALVAPLNLALVFVNAFLEGCQMIVAANMRRGAQAAAQVVAVFLVFTLGGKLWALGAGQLASFAAGGLWIILTQGAFLRSLLTGFFHNKQVSWRFEMWPLQWRYAVTWAAGPLVYGLFNPLIFSLAGSEAAGRFGFTFAIVGMLLAYSQIWIASRVAVFAKLNAGKRWQQLNSLFKRSAKNTLATYVLGVVVLLVGLYVISQNYPSLAVRLLDPVSSLLLALGSGLSLIIFIIGYFVRSFKEEPFVRMAWINAALVVTLAPAGIFFFQTRGASAAYLLSQSIVIPIAWQIYRKYRDRIKV